MQLSSTNSTDRQSSLRALNKWRPEAIILLLGIALYSFQLGQESLWIDEILSIGSAQGQLDLNRPLYFVLLRLWLRISQDEAWLRSLSVLFGLGSIGLTYWLGRQLSQNRRVGLVAALLFVLSPLAINHTQEVRFYMMSTFFGIGGSLCLSSAFRQPKFGGLCGWILFRCLGFLTAQPNALLLVPDCVLIAWALRLASIERQGDSSGQYTKAMPLRPGRLWVLGLIVVPLAVILKDVVPPLVEFLLTQRWYAGAAEPPTLTNLIGLMATLTAWPLQGPELLGNRGLLLDFFYRHLFNLYAISTLSILFLSITGPLTGPLTRSLTGPLKNRPLARQDYFPSPILQLALWGLLPILLIFFLSQFFPFLWLERYALISVPYIVILLSIGWRHLWCRYKTLAILAAALYGLSVSGPLIRYYTTDYHADWRGLSQQISLVASPNEPVVVYPGSFMSYIGYYSGYYVGKGTASTQANRVNFVPIENAESYQAVDTAQLTNTIQSLVLSSEQFWLVCPVKDQWGPVKDDLLEQLETKGFSLQQESLFVDHHNWGPALYQFSQS